MKIYSHLTFYIISLLWSLPKQQGMHLFSKAIQLENICEWYDDIFMNFKFHFGIKENTPRFHQVIIIIADIIWFQTEFFKNLFKLDEGGKKPSLALPQCNVTMAENVLFWVIDINISQEMTAWKLSFFKLYFTAENWTKNIPISNNPTELKDITLKFH